MRYAEARYRLHMRDVAYRIYVCDNIRMIGENTAKTVSITSRGEIPGIYVTKRFADIMGYSHASDIPDDLTGDDIFNDFLKHLGLEVDVDESV